MDRWSFGTVLFPLLSKCQPPWMTKGMRCPPVDALGTGAPTKSRAGTSRRPQRIRGTDKEKVSSHGQTGTEEAPASKGPREQQMGTGARSRSGNRAAGWQRPLSALAVAPSVRWRNRGILLGFLHAGSSDADSSSPSYTHGAKRGGRGLSLSLSLPPWRLSPSLEREKRIASPRSRPRPTGEGRSRPLGGPVVRAGPGAW